MCCVFMEASKELAEPWLKNAACRDKETQPLPKNNK